MRKVGVLLFTFILVFAFTACRISDDDPTTPSARPPVVLETTAPPVTDSPVTPPPATDPPATDPPVTEPPEADSQEDYGGIATLYTFVYSEGGSILNHVIGPNDCIPGYLYALNKGTDQIIQLLDEPVLKFTETTDSLYCITASNRILQTDYAGESRIVLYTPSNPLLPCIEFYKHALYFVEGDRVQKLDLFTGETITLYQQEGIVSVFPYKNTKLLIHLEEGHPISYDTATGELKVLSGEYDIDHELQ